MERHFGLKSKGDDGYIANVTFFRSGLFGF